MQESVLVEEAVQHARVDFLFFHDLAFLEVLHGYYEIFNSAVNFLVLS